MLMGRSVTTTLVDDWPWSIQIAHDYDTVEPTVELATILVERVERLAGEFQAQPVKPIELSGGRWRFEHPPFDRGQVAVLVGTTANLWRAAVEYVLTRNSTVGTKIDLPIQTDPAKLEPALKKLEGSGLSRAICDVVREHSPKKDAGNMDGLVLLREITNATKHRSLVDVFVHPRLGQIRPRNDSSWGYKLNGRHQTAVELFWEDGQPFEFLIEPQDVNLVPMLQVEPYGPIPLSDVGTTLAKRAVSLLNHLIKIEDSTKLHI